MSRIGRKPVAIPEKVKVSITGRVVRVEGPLGSLEALLPEGVGAKVEGDHLTVSAPAQNRSNRGFQGLTRALLANMVKGVLTGYERKLEINGVGYKAELRGTSLNFSLGYSHPIELALPKGIKAVVDKSQTSIVISGIDKQLVGQIAAAIRSFKPPEPYKGKGVKYADETIKRKVGKTGSK
jgi:large subunit ribosomal protein L6